ncbi:DUF397 domain-containing protein [Nocardiopsis sp. FIRDI 009]|uniref:DUF397 domain-containing protein n=1 Tax=Nocardiopsis sp. FIRDI 009 TaxID=714197 RepID=UPI000E258A4F|nr:DUF397 domain-containing protein [Nocardiopsis sp. FIRDI 009]
MNKNKVATFFPVAWHISTYSAETSGQCVEAGPFTDGSAAFAVRDSQHRSHGHLTFDPREWAALLASLE